MEFLIRVRIGSQIVGEEAVKDSRIDSGIGGLQGSRFGDWVGGGRAGSHLSWLFPHPFPVLYPSTVEVP